MFSSCPAVVYIHSCSGLVSQLQSWMASPLSGTEVKVAPVRGPVARRDAGEVVEGTTLLLAVDDERLGRRGERDLVPVAIIDRECRDERIDLVVPPFAV